MTNQKIELIKQALDDMQGQDITCIHVAPLTSMTDDIIICTSKSQRHGSSLLDAIIDLKGTINDANPLVEGDDFCEWILVDYHDVIIHIMLAETRSYYQLEKLWDTLLAPKN